MAPARTTIERLVKLVDRIDRHREKIAETQPLLVDTLALLDPLLEAHLALEERILFPAIARLGPKDQSEIVADIRSRRSGDQ